MKILRFMIILLSFIGIISCEKDNSNMDVERYIELLKSNHYDASNLPSFTYEDIPA